MAREAGSRRPRRPSAAAHLVSYNTNGFQDSASLKVLLNGLAASDTDIQEMAAAYDGNWVVVADGRLSFSPNTPRALTDQIQNYLDKKLDIDAVAFTPSGGWMVVVGLLDARREGACLAHAGLLLRRRAGNGSARFAAVPRGHGRGRADRGRRDP